MPARAQRYRGGGGAVFLLHPKFKKLYALDTIFFFFFLNLFDLQTLPSYFQRFNENSNLCCGLVLTFQEAKEQKKPIMVQWTEPFFFC